MLEGDAENYIVVTAPARNSLTGEMRFRDGFFESKERAVKALGWEYHMTAKTMLGAVLTGLTWNMSRTGRDLDQSKTAIKSWSITNARGELAAISAQLTSTLKKIVPDAKTIVVRKS